MKEFYVDFSGYVKVRAENEEDAKRKFWKHFVNNCSEPFSNDVWDIDGIEEINNNIPIDNPNKPSLQDLEDFWNDK